MEVGNSIRDKKEEKIPIPNRFGSLQIDNPNVQGFLALLAYSKLRPGVGEIDYSDLKSEENKRLRRAATQWWTEQDEFGYFPARIFGDYWRDETHPEHALEHIDPHNPEALEKLYRRVFEGETLAEQSKASTQPTLH